MKSLLIASMLCAAAFATRADEGMWLFNQPPRQVLQARYQFAATDAWLERSEPKTATQFVQIQPMEAVNV